MNVATACVMDWIGVTLAGSREPSAGIVLGTAHTSAAGPCTILGHSVRADPATAALVNGAAGHALDLDDTHPDIASHVTAAVLPAVLALAEARDSSGAELLEAFIAGVEFACALGRAVNPSHYDAGWHSASTVGVFGAAAGCAHLLGLDAARRSAAIGLAGAQAGGVKASFGTMAKHVQVGRAARDGLMSAVWAEAGLTAAADVIGDPQGFAALFAGRSSEVTPRPGAIEDTIFKYHAACHSTHGAIDGVRGLMAEHGLEPADVEHVEVLTAPITLLVCPFDTPRTGLEAKFSLPATVDMAIKGADTGDPATFAQAWPVTTPVTVTPDVTLTDWQTRVVITAGGRELRRDVTIGPELDVARLERKFTRLVGPAAAGALLPELRRLAELESLAPLLTNATNVPGTFVASGMFPAMGVLGIGGFFIRADDPDRLRAWYAQHLGVGAGEHGVWQTSAGPSVFMPFPRDSEYFGADHQWMLNLRVEGLDALLAELEASGIEVTTNPDWDMPGVGRFARIHDPEGNPVELWEPDDR